MLVPTKHKKLVDKMNEDASSPKRRARTPNVMTHTAKAHQLQPLTPPPGHAPNAFDQQQGSEETRARFALNSLSDRLFDAARVTALEKRRAKSGSELNRILGTILRTYTSDPRLEERQMAAKGVASTMVPSFDEVFNMLRLEKATADMDGIDYHQYIGKQLRWLLTEMGAANERHDIIKEQYAMLLEAHGKLERKAHATTRKCEETEALLKDQGHTLNEERKNHVGQVESFRAQIDVLRDKIRSLTEQVAVEKAAAERAQATLQAQANKLTLGFTRRQKGPERTSSSLVAGGPLTDSQPASVSQLHLNPADEQMDLIDELIRAKKEIEDDRESMEFREKQYKAEIETLKGQLEEERENAAKLHTIHEEELAHHQQLLVDLRDSNLDQTRELEEQCSIARYQVVVYEEKIGDLQTKLKESVARSQEMQGLLLQGPSIQTLLYNIQRGEALDMDVVEKLSNLMTTGASEGSDSTETSRRASTTPSLPMVGKLNPKKLSARNVVHRWTQVEPSDFRRGSIATPTGSQRSLSRGSSHNLSRTTTPDDKSRAPMSPPKKPVSTPKDGSGRAVGRGGGRGGSVAAASRGRGANRNASPVASPAGSPASSPRGAKKQTRVGGSSAFAVEDAPAMSSRASKSAEKVQTEKTPKPAASTSPSMFPLPISDSDLAAFETINAGSDERFGNSLASRSVTPAQDALPTAASPPPPATLTKKKSSRTKSNSPPKASATGAGNAPVTKKKSMRKSSAKSKPTDSSDSVGSPLLDAVPMLAKTPNAPSITTTPAEKPIPASRGRSKEPPSMKPSLLAEKASPVGNSTSKLKAVVAKATAKGTPKTQSVTPRSRTPRKESVKGPGSDQDLGKGLASTRKGDVSVVDGGATPTFTDLALSSEGSANMSSLFSRMGDTSGDALKRDFMRLKEKSMELANDNDRLSNALRHAQDVARDFRQKANMKEKSVQDLLSEKDEATATMDKLQMRLNHAMRDIATERDNYSMLQERHTSEVQGLNDALLKLKGELDRVASSNSQVYRRNRERVFIEGLERLGKSLHSVESAATCVACVEVLRDPLVLFPCGHLICDGCFRASNAAQNIVVAVTEGELMERASVSSPRANFMQSPRGNLSPRLAQMSPRPGGAPMSPRRANGIAQSGRTHGSFYMYCDECQDKTVIGFVGMKRIDELVSKLTYLNGCLAEVKAHISTTSGTTVQISDTSGNAKPVGPVLLEAEDQPELQDPPTAASMRSLREKKASMKS